MSQKAVYSDVNVTSSSAREARQAEAEARRNIEISKDFKSLGEPIKRIIRMVNKDISANDLKKLNKITVKQLAKVYEMLDLEEDPERIYAWVHRLATMKEQTEEPKYRKKKIDTGAQGDDPIKFYRELEKKNAELMEAMQKAAENREAERKANAEARARRQEEAVKKAQEEKERIEAAGGQVDTVKEMSEGDANDIRGAFDRFADKKSLADNSMASNDTEWWKKEKYCKEYEKKGMRGEMWNRVLEGGNEKAPTAELDARREYYRSQTWWKNEKFRKDFQSTRDSAWWKEEMYIEDWQTNKEGGKKWTAADEASGFGNRGDKRPASEVARQIRVDWYKNNGPKGIVKNWCAATEGSKDRCTLEEKLERIDFYKGGGWWKNSEVIDMPKGGNPALLECIRHSGVAAEDRDWWKDDKYREQYEKDKPLWKAINEQNAFFGEREPGMLADATKKELSKRKEWYDTYWWKTEKLIDDWAKGGTDWQPAEKGGSKVAAPFILQERSEWYKSADERTWWKDEEFLDDYCSFGQDGVRWTGAWKEAALAGEGHDKRRRALPEQLKKREDWYKKNWWKTDKIKKDFVLNQENGAMWKQATDTQPNAEWWKQSSFIKKYNASKKGSVEEFWKRPECIEDWVRNAAEGKMWTAETPAAASVAKGDKYRAPQEELDDRSLWYEENWWKAPVFVADFEANGMNGKKWRSTSHVNEIDVDGTKPIGTVGTTRRKFFYGPASSCPTFDADLEIDAMPVMNGHVEKPEERRMREHGVKNSWWKCPEVREDWEKLGETSFSMTACSPESAHSGDARPEFRTTQEEITQRNKWMEAGKDDRLWYEKGTYFREWSTFREPLFWKNPDMIHDWLAHGETWKASSAIDATTGHFSPASATELETRVAFYTQSFWRAPEYKQDYEEKGSKGVLWTSSEPGGKGKTCDENELKARMAYYKPAQSWTLKEKDENLKNKICSRTERRVRGGWYERNWWKTGDVREDYEKHGKASTLLAAATQAVVDAGLQSEADFMCSAAERQERIDYFGKNDTEWWQRPPIISDYVQNGVKGGKWPSRTEGESKQSLGLEMPDLPEELKRREAWYAKNSWKSAHCMEDFNKKGSEWKKGAEDDAGELKNRENWMKQNQFVSDDEQKKRKEWLRDQTTDEEKLMRRNWILRQKDESKRIQLEELPDALAALNDGRPPSAKQLRAVLDSVRKRRETLGMKGDEADADTVTEEEFLHAVADTAFYIGLDDGERRRLEEETLDAMRQEEMARAEEEAAFLAMEREEELQAAGLEYEEVDQAAAAEEAAFLAEEQAAEDAKQAAVVNEDDVAIVEEDAYEEYMDSARKGRTMKRDLTPEEQLKVEEAEDAVKKQRQMKKDAMAAFDRPTHEESIVIEEEEDDFADEDKLIDEDEWEEDEEFEEEEEEDEIMRDEIAQTDLDHPPDPSTVFLKDVANNKFLKTYFPTIKHGKPKQKKTWAVDHFSGTFYQMDENGKLQKEHSAKKLLQLEKNVTDPTRLRMMFIDAPQSYEIQFKDPFERERFFETASAVRPAIRCYAPDLTTPEGGDAQAVTIEGSGENKVTVNAKNAKGKHGPRELEGSCKINASKELTEPVSIYTATLNFNGQRPKADDPALQEWIPKDKYDIYAIAGQGVGWQRDDTEWNSTVQKLVGPGHVTIATMTVFDITLVVLARKRHLLKITNCEGSTRSTIHTKIAGEKGGVAICLRYMETSFCFVSLHLAARFERVALRNTILEEICEGVQLAVRETEFTNQFNHIFCMGDFNYRVVLSSDEASKFIQSEKFDQIYDKDQLLVERKERGFLHGFHEGPVDFAPTYRYNEEHTAYKIENGQSPSYCSRIITRTMENCKQKQAWYRSFPDVQVGEHQPIAALFVVRAIRPVVSFLNKGDQSILQAKITKLQLFDSTSALMVDPHILLSAQWASTIVSDLIKATTQNTNSPIFDAIPAMTSNTTSADFLESQQLLIVLRDLDEKRFEKAHRGTGCLSLNDRVHGKIGQEQSFEIEMIYNGKFAGMLKGAFKMVAVPKDQQFDKLTNAM